MVGRPQGAFGRALSKSEHILHVIKSCRLLDHPCSRLHRPPGKIVPVMGAMDQLQSLTYPPEHHRMFTRNIPGPPGLHADLFIGSLSDDSLPLIDRRLFNIPAHSLRQHLGWLVVWGGVFGGLLGAVFSFV